MSDVVIVGAGPAGASIAYLLARNDIAVTLLERQPDFDREFRGEGLLPSGLAVLRAMGLEREVNLLPRRVIETVEVFLHGRSLFNVSVSGDQFDGLTPCVLSQPALLQLLVNQAARYPGFRFEPGTAVIELTTENACVTGVRTRTDRGERDIAADLVIATDGRSSLIRRRAGLDPGKSQESYEVVWYKLPPPPYGGPTNSIRFYLGDRTWIVVFPSYDGLLQVGCIVPQGSLSTTDNPTDLLLSIADRVSSDLGPHFRALGDAVPRPFLLHVVSSRASRWTRSGLLLLGDAAHPMSPIGAQGVNVALADALVAANHLCPVLAGAHTREALDAASRRVEDERRPQIAKVQRLQGLPPRFVFGRSALSRLVIRALPALARSGALPLLYQKALRRLALGSPLRLHV